MRLYCHSTGREAKERGIAQRCSTRLEAELEHLAEGWHRKGRVKRYEKVLIRIGRLRLRDSRVARYYDIRLEKDETSGHAARRQWTRITPPEDTLPGVYCLRTNQAQWDECTLWHTYTLLQAQSLTRLISPPVPPRPCASPNGHARSTQV